MPSWVTRWIYSGQTSGEILPIHGYYDGRKDQYRSFMGIGLFRLVGPPLHPGVVAPYLVQGAWFPSHLPLEGTGHIYSWVITGDPVPRVQNLIVALEPSVKRVAMAIHSTGGRIGTHMSLRVSLWDSVVRPRG
jgi:hypothetical protein